MEPLHQMERNHCTEWNGTTALNGIEPLHRMEQNHCTEWNGTTAPNGTEPLHGMEWNHSTQWNGTMEWNQCTEWLLHVLVRMVFLMHCRVTWPCALPSGVKGVSKTNRLILFSRSNLVLRSCSSSEVKYGSTKVIWMWAWSKSREEGFTYECVWVNVGRNA